MLWMRLKLQAGGLGDTLVKQAIFPHPITIPLNSPSYSQPKLICYAA
jgi:hypothetical protein